MIKFIDDKDSTYLSRTYTVQASYEVYNGVKSERSDKFAKVVVNIFVQAGIPDFVHCMSDGAISNCKLPKACVVHIDGLQVPGINLRWTGESFEVDIITVGDEYVLGFSFETPTQKA